jgi:hypothetical protein
MVSDAKLKRRLPGLLIEGKTSGSDPRYQRKYNQLKRLERHEPIVYNGLLVNLKIALAGLDRAAEQSGFQHIGLDERGNIVRKK